MLTLADKLRTLLNLFYIISGAVQVCEAYNNKYYGTINVTYLNYQDFFLLNSSLISVISMFDYSSINPLNPKIKNLILICFPCSFHTKEVGRSFCMIMSLILIYFDHSVSYINALILQGEI